MKIAVSKVFYDYKKNPIKTLQIQMRDLKPSIRRGIKEEGLYFLENIFGNSDGHGQGWQGEDISFTVQPRTRTSYLVHFNLNKYLDVSESIDLFDQNRKPYGDAIRDINDELARFIIRKLCK